MRVFWAMIGGRLFRNNVGTGWQGSKVLRMPDGSMVLKNPRPFNAGLIKGSSDTIGWTPVIISQGMVGKTLAVFTAIEVKWGKDRATKEQIAFIEAVNKAGGIAFIARTEEQVKEEWLLWQKKNGST